MVERDKARRAHDQASGSGAVDPLEWLVRSAERTPPEDHPQLLELRAVRIVRARLAEALTPVRLASELYVSLRTLQRGLAQALGCTPGELILAVKMREARHLLQQGTWQVQEVALRVGYENPSHFSRRFKAYFGVSPALLLSERVGAAGIGRPAA